MHASDLMEDYPTVELHTPALDAARMIGGERHPALVVLHDGRPYTVLPGYAVLSFLIPRYLQEDPSLARLYDEASADRCLERLTGTTVRELLPDKDRRTELPVVDAAATVVECAALMGRLRTPLLVVADDAGPGDASGAMLGAITASRLVSMLIP